MTDTYTHDLDSENKHFIHTLDGFNLLLSTILRFNIKGIENIPVSGPGILVMNHSALPIDGMLLVAHYLHKKNRIIRPLISKNLRKHPLIRKSVQFWGGVDANAYNALHLLKRGDLVLIYPGGPQEALKDDRMQYKLMWGEETGFVKLALLTGAPVIPVASIGLDENFHLISNGLMLNRLIFGKDAFLLPIVRPRHIIPQKVTLYIGEPITFPYPSEAVKDTSILQKLQHQVKDVLENMLSPHGGEN